MLLSRMFYFIESGKIQDPIYSPEQAPLGTSNKDFLQEYVASLLQSAFKNLKEYVIFRVPLSELMAEPSIQDPNQAVRDRSLCFQ
jgi:hypothetical protein